MISDERILGFIEGEGCFSIVVRKYVDTRVRKTDRKNNVKKQSLPYRVMPDFRISLAEKDINILNKIKERFGFGNISKVKDKGPNNLEMVQYYVGSLEDLLKLSQIFSNLEFYTTKGKDYALWTECLNLIKEGKHLTKEGLQQIFELREKMNFHKNKFKKNKTIDL